MKFYKWFIWNFQQCISSNSKTFYSFIKFNIRKINEITNFFYRTALHCAVENEEPDVVQLLVNCKGIDINAKDEILIYC